MAYLKKPDKVKRHLSSSADYNRAKDRFEAFIRKYENVNFTEKERDKALEELKEIKTDTSALSKKAIPPKDHVFKSAEESINSESSSSSDA